MQSVLSLFIKLLMGYSRKNPLPPPRWGRFLTPSHLGFLKHKISPPVWISKTKDPSCLDFQEKNSRLQFNLFLTENTYNHVQKMFFFNF